MKKLFSYIWKHRLGKGKVVRVKGWRTALVDYPYGRETVTFLLNVWKGKYV